MMSTMWRIHDLAAEPVRERWIGDIASIFLDGFGLGDDDAWPDDRIAHAIRSVSFLALAYHFDDGADQEEACGYAMYTIPCAPLGDAYFLWERCDLPSEARAAQRCYT